MLTTKQSLLDKLNNTEQRVTVRYAEMHVRNIVEGDYVRMNSVTQRFCLSFNLSVFTERTEILHLSKYFAKVVLVLRTKNHTKIFYKYLGIEYALRFKNDVKLLICC